MVAYTVLQQSYTPEDQAFLTYTVRCLICDVTGFPDDSIVLLLHGMPSLFRKRVANTNG